MSRKTTIAALVAFAVLSALFTANFLQAGRHASARIHAVTPVADDPAGPSTSPSFAGTAPSERQSAASDDNNVQTIAVIQRELTRRGYSPGAEVGIAGLQTRAAIMAFEEDQGLPVTAEPAEQLLEALLFAPESAGSAKPAYSMSPNAHRVIRAVQAELNAQGFKIARIDGLMGERTASAIRDFEASLGIKTTGRITGRLVGRLTDTDPPRPARSAAHRR